MTPVAVVSSLKDAGRGSVRAAMTTRIRPHRRSGRAARIESDMMRAIVRRRVGSVFRSRDQERFIIAAAPRGEDVE